MPPLFIAAIVLLVLFFIWLFRKGRKSAAGNIELGNTFLENNKMQEGVETTSSGLQYLRLEKGEGDQHPAAKDKVTVHYHGTLLDGTIFDSSVQRGQPIDFGLNQVIPGWTEGVQLMVIGDKMRFFIPSHLAYGNQGSGAIKPGSTLIFEVKLLGIN